MVRAKVSLCFDCKLVGKKDRWKKFNTEPLQSEKVQLAFDQIYT